MSEIDGQGEMLPGASVSNLGESDVVASLSAFARAFGTDRETLRRRLLDAGVEPAAERGGHKIYRLAEVFRAWALSGQVVDPETLSPFNRRAWYQAELDRLKLQQNRGELIPRLEVEQEQAGVLKIVAEMFDTLPDIIERDCGATPLQLNRIEQVLDRSREELHARLTEVTAEEAAQQTAAPARETAPAGAQEQKKAAAARAAAPSGALDAAASYLSEALGAGPRLAAELIAEAAARHVSETSLRRAKAKLGIVARRAGKGWAWELAEQDVQDGQAT